MGDDRIQDIPSLAKLLKDAEGVALLSKALPWVSPLLRLLGVDVEKLKGALAPVADLKLATEELVAVPDRFNELFAVRGWIVYDSLNLNVAKSAIAAAESGSMAQAEEMLVNYYSDETIGFQLRRLLGVRSFAPRFDLACRAAEDYSASRYHACVPVVLALLDGTVNDLAARGFFAKDADLTAWDSIAAHEKGLGQLARIFTQSRKKTRTDEIQVPYRHGIMHGMDLGYANRTVAAKSWAALFATGDWARKIESGEKEPQEDPAQPTWPELLTQLRENAEDRKRLEDWRPRDLQLGTDLPVSGLPAEYANGTPERALVEFLELWKQRNYGQMAGSLPYPRQKPLARLAGEVRGIYGEHPLSRFALSKITDTAAAMTEIDVACKFAPSSESPDRVITFRLVYQDQEGSSVIRGKQDAQWIVMNYGWI